MSTPSTAPWIIYVLPDEREWVESLPGFMPVEDYWFRELPRLPNELGCVVSDMTWRIDERGFFRGTAGEVLARYFLLPEPNEQSEK